jgi:hypothetical protein
MKVYDDLRGRTLNFNRRTAVEHEKKACALERRKLPRLNFLDDEHLGNQKKTRDSLFAETCMTRLEFPHYSHHYQP